MPPFRPAFIFSPSSSSFSSSLSASPSSAAPPYLLSRRFTSSPFSIQSLLLPTQLQHRTSFTHRPTPRSSVTFSSSSSSSFSSCSSSSSNLSPFPSSCSPSFLPFSSSSFPSVVALSSPFSSFPSRSFSTSSPLPPTPHTPAPTPALLSTPSSASHSAELADSIASVSSSDVCPPASVGFGEAANSVSNVATPEDLNAGSRVVLEYLHLLHDFTGLPWWASIIVGTLLIRLSVLPIAIHGARNSAKMAFIRDDLAAIQEAFKVKRESPQGVTNADAVELHRQRSAIMSSAGVNFKASFLMPFVSAPIFIVFFLALKSGYQPLMFGGIPGVLNGALFDLNAPASNPFYLLPIVNASILLSSIHFGAMDKSAMKPSHYKLMSGGLSFLAVIMVPLTHYLPQAVFWYWASSGLISWLQGLLLKRSAVKRLFRIPDPPASRPNGKSTLASIGKQDDDKLRKKIVIPTTQEFRRRR